MNTKRVPHYAMTLGGYRTSLSYPVLSSHSYLPREERLKIGITDGMMRVSVGMENTEDLVNDFMQAMEVFGKEASAAPRGVEDRENTHHAKN